MDTTVGGNNFGTQTHSSATVSQTTARQTSCGTVTVTADDDPTDPTDPTDPGDGGESPLPGGVPVIALGGLAGLAVLFLVLQ